MSFNPFISRAMLALLLAAVLSACHSFSAASKSAGTSVSGSMVRLSREQARLYQIETAPVAEEQIQHILTLLGRVNLREVGETRIFCRFMDGLHYVVPKLNRR